jgi:hypothetical protein
MLIFGAQDPRLTARGHHAEAHVAGLIAESFGGPLAGDRWIAFYGIHVRQLTLPRDGELGPDHTPVDPLRELDFLVFDRLRGFAVLEVKGGRLRRTRQGIWERWGWPAPLDATESEGNAGDPEASRNAAPTVEKTWVPTRDPMEQARSGMNNLLRRLKERIGGNAFKGNPLWHSHAVLMPDVDATKGGLPPDWNKFVMATVDQLQDAAAFEAWLEAHFEYTASAHGKHTSDRVTALVARVIEDCIMPPFTGERTARKQIARLAEADRRTMDGTTPIHEFVHSKLRRDSVLIEGAAGTGKTHAAVLRAMHELETKPSGRVLYLCFNELLAEQVASGPASRFGERFTALPFRALCERECARAEIHWPADGLDRAALTDFYRHQASALLQEAIRKAPRSAGERPTMLIIDEAQDFNERWLHAIEVLTGSDCIRWCLYDPAQLLFGNLSLDSSGGDSTETADDLAERLAKRFGKPDLMLRNQRLSGRVFEHLRSRGIIPHKESMLDPNALEGFETTEMQAARSYARKAIHHAILHAIDELQFAPEQILVQAAITPSNDEHPLFRAKGPWTGDGPDPWDVAGRFRLARIEDGDAMPDDAIEMATAQKFKGCERPYSIVIRTPSMDAARFYTACTRARLGLVIIDVVD